MFFVVIENHDEKHCAEEMEMKTFKKLKSDNLEEHLMKENANLEMPIENTNIELSKHFSNVSTSKGFQGMKWKDKVQNTKCGSKSHKKIRHF